jgi:hypothetical protein
MIHLHFRLGRIDIFIRPNLLLREESYQIQEGGIHHHGHQAKKRPVSISALVKRELEVGIGANVPNLENL